MKSTLQIFFCKPPVLGLVKTRLARFLGEQRARDLYAALCQRVITAFPAERLRLYSGTDMDLDRLLELFADGTPPGGTVRIQHGEDLGERMARALHEIAVDPGTPDDVDRILLTGTDIPDYDPEIAARVAALLDDNECALAPTGDGGYYCVGVQRKVAQDLSRMHQIMSGIQWSTPEVFQVQKEKMEAAGLRVGVGPGLEDLDVIEDFAEWRSKQGGDTFLEEFFPDIRVVLPVFNEEPNLRFVLEPLLASGLFREIICADNGSTDNSAAVAREMGARVTECPRRGYGATCLTALRDIAERGGCEVVLFMDADGADEPAMLPALLGPVVSGHYDFALGHRRPDLAEPGALLPQARFGNGLVSVLTRMLWGFRYHDLGPYRAINWAALEALNMDDQNFGWTIQMQVRALNDELRVREIPVPYRKRHGGESKVTATFKGTILAGYKILYTVGREWLAALFSGRLPRRSRLRQLQQMAGGEFPAPPIS